MFPKGESIMENIGANIRKRRIELSWTQEELAEKMGYKSKTSINKIELGINDIPQSKVAQFAEVMFTTPASLMGWDKESNTIKARKIPVYGRVAAGIPIEAMENIIDYEEIPDTWPGEYAALSVKGDSMAPRIEDGDVLIVRLQDDAESGDIVVAIINGEDATVKRLIKYKDGITLQPLNPSYEPMYFSEESQRTIPVRIWGKVVENRAKL